MTDRPIEAAQTEQQKKTEILVDTLIFAAAARDGSVGAARKLLLAHLEVPNIAATEPPDWIATTVNVSDATAAASVLRGRSLADIKADAAALNAALASAPPAAATGEIIERDGFGPPTPLRWPAPAAATVPGWASVALTTMEHARSWVGDGSPLPAVAYELDNAIDMVARVVRFGQPAAATVEVPDERKAFEAWAKERDYDLDRKDGGGYLWDYVEAHWRTWQARAALSTPTAQKAEGGEVPAAYLVTFPNEPELGHYLTEERPDSSLGVIPLYARPTPAAAAGVPPGWKLVEDFHVGDRVLFEGVEHVIYALGDKAGTFDLHRPYRAGNRWTNVPPSALKYAPGSPLLAASGAPAGAPSTGEQQPPMGDVHPAAPSGDRVHRAEGGVNAPCAGGSAHG